MAISTTNVQSAHGLFSATTTLNYTLTANAQWLVIAHYADYAPNQRAITGATFNGNACTQLQIADDGGASGRIVSGFVYDVSALGAVNADAVVSLDTAGGCNIVCFCLESADPILYRTASAGSNGSSTNANNTATTTTGDFVLSFIGWDGKVLADVTPDSGQSNIGFADASRGFLGVYSQTAAGASTNSNFSVAGADDFGTFSVPFYESGAARSITDIDGDDTVQAGQTNVTITTVGLDASPATQTATLGGETLTVNSWSATAVNVDIPLHIDLEWGSTTNQLSLTDDTGTVTLNNVTLSVPTGWETVTYGGSAPNPATTESFYEYAQTDTDLGGGGFTMAANDILAWETQTGLTIDTQTIPIVAPPATVTGDYKIWDDSLSAWTSVSVFTITDGGTFVDAPTLSSPTGAKNGSNGATGTVTTDESGGTLYFLASTNSSESAATIKASTDNQPVVATGVQNVTVTGLSASTTYYIHYIHVDSETNDSNVVSSSSFTTDAASGGGFNSYKEWMESLPPGSFTTKLRVFLEGKGYSGSTTTMLYEYLKTVSSKGNHQERKTDWEDGGWN